MDRVHHSAAGDGEPEAIAEQPLDAAEGQATLFIQDHGERDGLRAKLRGGRTQRIGGLERMAALHTAVALAALPDRDAKLVHHGALDRQVFLVLRDHALSADGAATVRALRGQRRLMRVVDVARRGTMRLPAIGGARLAARPLGMRLRQAARKRRRLAIRAALRHLEFFLQSLVLAAQPVALDLGAPHVLAEPLVLAPQILDDLLGTTRRRHVLRAPRHAPVMPNPRTKYKSNHVEYAV